MCVCVFVCCNACVCKHVHSYVRCMCVQCMQACMCSNVCVHIKSQIYTYGFPSLQMATSLGKILILNSLSLMWVRHCAQRILRLGGSHWRCAHSAFWFSMHPREIGIGLKSNRHLLKSPSRTYTSEGLC